MSNYDFLIADCDNNGGIYRYRKTENGIEQVAKLSLPMPMYMTIEENKLYVILRNKDDSSSDSGLISYDISGNEFINPSQIQSTKGEVACHLTVCNGTVYCVNYVSGSVIKMPDKLVQLQGKGPHHIRQTKPHTHFVTKTFDNYILVTDLGTDSIITFTEDLEEISRTHVPSGHGARHLVFSKDNKYVYCINELKATVSVFSYINGQLILKGTYASLPVEFKEQNTAAAIRISADGNYLYVSNRGHDSITAFEIKGEDLILRSITPCGGKGPRDFNIIDSQIICTNENSGNVTIFDVNGASLSLCDEITGLKNPLCVIEI